MFGFIRQVERLVILHEEAEDGNAMPDLERPVQAVSIAVTNLVKVATINILILNLINTRLNTIQIKKLFFRIVFSDANKFNCSGFLIQLTRLISTPLSNFDELFKMKRNKCKCIRMICFYASSCSEKQRFILRNASCQAVDDKIALGLNINL